MGLFFIFQNANIGFLYNVVGGHIKTADSILFIGFLCMIGCDVFRIRLRNADYFSLLIELCLGVSEQLPIISSNPLLLFQKVMEMWCISPVRQVKNPR